MPNSTNSIRTPWWERLERAWHAWRPGATLPAWKEFLPQGDEPIDPDHLILLVQIDIEFRCKAGVAALLTEAYFEYPALAALNSDQQSELIRWEYQQRWKNGQRASKREYQEAFPDLAQNLDGLKPRWGCPICRRQAIPLDDELSETLTCPHCSRSFPGSEIFRPVHTNAALSGNSTRTQTEIPPIESGRQVVPGYEIVDVLGRGGMGVVYRARDLVVGRDVALKFLQDRFPPRSSAALRFLEEAQITGQLQHPSIPPVHQIGELPDGRPYLAMKLIKGRTLQAILSDASPRELNLLAVFEAVCQAVGYAHAHQVIHRDLKPENIMVGSFGEVQVMDWGLAKVLSAERSDNTDPALETAPDTEIRSPRSSSECLTEFGSVLGTPAFMSPEQAAGESARVDQRSDVFSLGAILCVILTGKPPYVGDDVKTVWGAAVRGQLDDAHARLSASQAEGDLIDLARRCLSFAPENRPADGSAVAAEVANLRADAEQRARNAEIKRASEAVRAAEGRKRRRVQQALLASLVLVCTLLGVGWWWQDRQQSKRRAEHDLNRQAVATALDQAESSLRKPWPIFGEIDPALGQVEHLLADNEDLRARWQELRQASKLLEQLDSINQRRGVSHRASIDPTGKFVQERYAAAFRDYAINPQEDTVAALAERVRRSPLASRIGAALQDWLRYCEDRWLVDLVNALDADPGRIELRHAYIHGQADVIAGMLAGLDGREFPVAFSIFIGEHKLTPYAEAIRILKAAQAAHPEEFHLTEVLADRLYTRRPSLAIPYYRVALALRPGYMMAHYNLGYVLFRNSLELHPGDLHESIEKFRDAIRIDPADARPHVGLGAALLYEDLDGAAASFAEAIRLDPDYCWGHHGLGAIFFERNDVDGAIAEFREAIRLAAKWPEDEEFAEIHCDLGKTLLKKQDLDGALAEYRIAVRINPDNPDGFKGVARVLGEQGKSKEAYEFLRNQAERRPEWLDEIGNSFRYDLACSAILWSDEQGVGAPRDPERPTLRKKALAWLQANLSEWRKRSSDPELRSLVAEEMEQWLDDEDLAAVRDKGALKAMPASERQAWQQFWTEVRRLREATELEVLPPPRPVATPEN